MTSLTTSIGNTTLIDQFEGLPARTWFAHLQIDHLRFTGQGLTEQEAIEDARARHTAYELEQDKMFARLGIARPWKEAR